MKLKENLITTLLLTIGLLLHYIVPGIFMGMKFDFLLIFIFIAVLVNPKPKNIILASLLGGLMSSMTTSFPGGQLPNMIDKIITGCFLYLVLGLVKNRLNTFSIASLGALGTLVSGSVFLASAKLILSLDINVLSLVKFVVLPTALINSIGTVFLYNIVARSLKIARVN